MFDCEFVNVVLSYCTSEELDPDDDDEGSNPKSHKSINDDEGMIDCDNDNNDSVVPMVGSDIDVSSFSNE